MKIFARFFEALQLDIKAFVYWCFIFMLFRVIFIAVYSSQLNGDFSELGMALWLGLRLSLKTAGWLAAAGFLAAGLPNFLLSKWPAAKIRLAWHGAAIIFFSICFMARIPYYKIFNAAFNMMLVNGVHDDWYAILVTAVAEYQLWWRLPAALLLGAALVYALYLWLHYTKQYDFGKLRYKKAVAAGVIFFVPLLCIFVRYGGAMAYANSINWESAARLRSNLLNEAVLDDGQALYRVYSGKKLLAKINDVNISKAELLDKITFVGGNPQAHDIDGAFLRRVQQPKLKRQPDNIVVILGESFGQWPLLPRYRNLGLTDNMLRLQESQQGAYIRTMLAHGSGTIAAVNGLLTGLPSSGLYANYQPMSFESKYSMGIGYVMKHLGYKTVFWYGGFPGWQNLKSFVLAQSFDEFHCADEFDYSGGNAWGCPDELLLQKVQEYIVKESDNEKVLHVILTTSNHPPYTLPIDKIGFQRKQVRSKLPGDISGSEQSLTEMGHIWYADKTMGDFVAGVQNQRQDTLFVITGDHSERFSFALEQDIRTVSTIPCIFYGEGVRQSWFDEKSVGCHMQLAGTLAEIIAPPGFTYSSMLPSMFAEPDFVFNHSLYAADGEIGIMSKGKEEWRKYANDMRGTAAWRILKGAEL